MGSLPSRPVELSSLTFGDVTILSPSEAARTSSTLCDFLSSLSLSDNDATTSYISSLFRTEFVFDLLLRGAKNDYLRDGLPKPLAHHGGHVFSPALVLLFYAIRQAQRIVKKTGSFPSPTNPFFCWANDVNKKLSVDSISNRVTKVAKEFLGIRTTITARSWRVAAANALIDAGISIERVAKLGGWKDIETLRQHYIRWRPMSHQQWLAASGAPEKRAHHHRQFLLFLLPHHFLHHLHHQLLLLLLLLLRLPHLNCVVQIAHIMCQRGSKINAKLHRFDGVLRRR